MERSSCCFSVTCSMIPSRSMISMLRSAIAHWVGCPPNVLPWWNFTPGCSNGATTLSDATTALIDAYVEERPLPIEIRSGLMS